MIPFSLIGEGPPLKRLATYIKAQDGARLVHVFSNSYTDRDVAVSPGKDIHAKDVVARLQDVDKGWFVSVNNFDHIIPARVLRLFGGRALNLHLGILPEYAGRHAYQWAIRNGEEETGTAIHYMEEEFDIGDVVSVFTTPISAQDTGLSVFWRCLDGGVVLFERVVDDLVAGRDLSRIPQDRARRHAYKSADVGDGRIDWSMPAQAVCDFIRAANFLPFQSPSYTPWFTDALGERVDVFKAVLSEGSSAPARIVCGDGQAVEIVTARKNGVQVPPSDVQFLEKAS